MQGSPQRCGEASVVQNLDSTYHTVPREENVRGSGLQLLPSPEWLAAPRYLSITVFNFRLDREPEARQFLFEVLLQESVSKRNELDCVRLFLYTNCQPRNDFCSPLLGDESVARRFLR